jgi:hypothetical protein
VGICDLHPTIHTIHTILAASVTASIPAEAMLGLDLQHDFLKW